MIELFFFFFQAEDGIRDYKVTGVRRVLFRSTRPVQPLACFFCRGRKIACGPPAKDGSGDRTCEYVLALLKNSDVSCYPYCILFSHHKHIHNHSIRFPSFPLLCSMSDAARHSPSLFPLSPRSCVPLC